MQEDTQINSLKCKLDTDDDIKITDQYIEPKNDIINSWVNQIDNKEQ